jgi:hypothetical protein
MLQRPEQKLQLQIHDKSELGLVATKLLLEDKGKGQKQK